MATTVLTLIESAFRLIDVLQPGYSATALDYAAAFDALNQLVASWSAEGTMIYSVVDDTVSSNATELYTWGSAGAFTTAKPVRIKSARAANTANVSMPIEIVTSERWDAVLDRSANAQGFPEILYYDYALPTGFLKVWPIFPAGGTIVIHSYKAVPSFGATSDVVNLPPGYEMALRYNLAIVLGPEHRRQLDPSIPPIAAQTKAALAQLNAAVLGTEIAKTQ